MSKKVRLGDILRRTAITAALLTVYGYALHAVAVNLLIGNEHDYIVHLT